MTARTRLTLLAALATAAFALLAGPALAASPWWNLNASLRPASLQPGGEGTLIVRVTNVGDAPTSGPVSLSANLPPGVTVKTSKKGVPQVRFLSPLKSANTELGPTGPNAGLELCKATTTQVTCTAKPEDPGLEYLDHIAPYEQLEIRVGLSAEGGASSGEYEAEVSGGEAPVLSRRRPLGIGEGEVPFGTEDLSLVPEEEGGTIDTQAGSHPFQLTATFNLNQTSDSEHPPALPKDLHFKLAPGQLGNVTALPKCTAIQFSTIVQGANLCPDATVIGVSEVAVFEPANHGLTNLPVPLFNLEPKRGEPARFGFEVISSPIILDTSLRSGPGEDYGVTVSVANVTQITNFLSSTLTFWGAPGDPRHDQSRGWGCLASDHWSIPGKIECNPSTQNKPPAFLTLPTNCSAPFDFSAEGVSWPSQANPFGLPLAPFTYSLQDNAGNSLGLTACNQIPFAPAIKSEPTSNAATSPTGLSFGIDFNDEGLLNAEGLAQSEIKKAVVSLPQGFTTNPSVAEGLKACSQGQYESETVNSEPGAGCPNESKIGDVEIESPLVEEKVNGSLYVAEQHNNPYGNLLTIYLVAKNPEIGVLVKQALKVTPDPRTGQLTTEVDDIPQLPFSHFQLSFRQGQRSPLVTPQACGTYAVQADLYPWSNPAVPLHQTSSFQITRGPEDQPCPSGATPPFHPNLEAGTVNNRAGSYSPFYVHMTRKDSEQEITHFSIKLPPGVSGKLAGIPECSDSGIAAAKAREHEGGGGQEEASPSCPKASEIGHSLVGSGVGNVLAYAPGKMYLAGPYHGSNLSLVSITAAKVGPFDLGTVVVRFALKIDPETAEVSVDGATSDPIPHIVDGIPVHLRDIRAYVDKPQFVLNPTNCTKTSTASTVLGSGLNFASEADDVPVTVSSPFQAADCASLGFAPKLALSLKGGTKRGSTPAFKAVLTYPKGSYANIAESQVTLPHSEFLEQAHIGTVCTRTQFKEGKVPGEKCPAASIYGRARAVTPILDEALEGPVYLRSSSHNLPDLVVALHNKQVDIALDGRIDSVENGRIRNTFEAVPDAPVSKFVLEMQGGKKGLLVNSTNICKTEHKAISHFVGQNGKVYDTNPVLQAQCGGKAKKKAKGGKKGTRHR